MTGRVLTIGAWMDGGGRRSKSLKSIRVDVADFDRIDIAPAVDAIDEAAFVVTRCDIIGVGGHSGGADQRAGGKADAKAGAEFRLGPRFPADGGEGGGEGEGCEGGSNGFGFGHDASPTVVNWGGRRAAYQSVVDGRKKVQSPRAAKT